LTITTHDEKQQDHPQHPVLRWIGHALGLAYVLVTLLFGPIRSLARRLGQEQIVQRYERRVATLPPAVGLSLSLLSLALLELSNAGSAGAVQNCGPVELPRRRSAGSNRGDVLCQGRYRLFRPYHLAGCPPESDHDLSVGSASGCLGRNAIGATARISRPLAGLFVQPYLVSRRHRRNQVLLATLRPLDRYNQAPTDSHDRFGNGLQTEIGRLITKKRTEIGRLITKKRTIQELATRVRSSAAARAVWIEWRCRALGWTINLIGM